MTMRPLAIALSLFLATLVPANAAERILQFISDAAVERNGELVVTETIRVEAEGREIRRGILRDFPTRYAARDGAQVEVGFHVEAVTRDGSPETFVTEPLANGMRVRIGNAERLLANGQHTYVIRYRTTRQIGFFPDYDELYWNATGTGWTFAIEQAEARITLPERVPLTRPAFYTGPQGAQGRDVAIVEQQPGRIVFRTTRPLSPRSGLTVAAAWQKGVVEPPTTSQRAGWWLSDNLAVPVAIAGLVLVLGFYLYAWQRVGRDPPRGTIIPLFGPPDGMSAAAVRYVDREGFDPRCFTAAIIDLGVNGHVKLTGTGKSTVLERRAGGQPLPAPERTMESRLFATKPSLVLDRANYGPLGKARQALQQGLSEAYLGKLFRNNFGWSILGLIASIVLVVAILVCVATTHPEDQAAMLIAGMIIPTPLILGGAAAIYAGWRRKRFGWLLVFAGIVLIVVPAALGLLLMLADAPGWVDIVPAAVPYVLASIVGLAFPWLQAPTVAGRKIMDQIEGFRMYLGVAEEDRLNALNPPEKTPELFERFLPYAVALDVENRWAERFASVLATAGAGAAIGSWYAGYQNSSNDPIGFVNHRAAIFRRRSQPRRPRPARATGAAAVVAAARPVVAAAEEAGRAGSAALMPDAPRRSCAPRCARYSSARGAPKILHERASRRSPSPHSV